MFERKIKKFNSTKRYKLIINNLDKKYVNFHLFTLFLVFVVFLFFITSSFAHQPVLNTEEKMDKSKPYIINEPEISKAIYSTLNGNYHYYKISSDKSFNFYVGLTVPKIDDCVDFLRFSFAILDHDFHTIHELDGQNFQWWEWYEPYGRKWYWVGPEYGKDFKSTHVFNSGTYYIKVYNKENKGNYVLAVGDIEKFTPLVIAKTIVTLPRINKKFWDASNCN